MKSKLCIVIILAFFAQFSIAQDSQTKSTDVIMSQALKMASKENKNVFLMWHASWCGFCKKMDTLMNDPSVKKYFDDSFVITHLVVRERGEKEHLNNEGSDKLMAKYHGEKAGIPFWVVLDKNGKLLADSFMRPEGVGMDKAGKNTGCPLQKEEVEHWVSVLKKTTDIPDDGLKKIYNKFLKK